jgi:hypothetical protein
MLAKNLVEPSWFPRETLTARFHQFHAIPEGNKEIVEIGDLCVGGPTLRSNAIVLVLLSSK